MLSFTQFLEARFPLRTDDDCNKGRPDIGNRVMLSFTQFLEARYRGSVSFAVDAPNRSSALGIIHDLGDSHPAIEDWALGNVTAIEEDELPIFPV